MSGKKFALSFIPLLALGLVGFWLNFRNRDAVAGILLMFVAVVGLVVVFRRDLKTTEAEERAAWAKARALGRRKFVLRQVFVSLLILLAPLTATLCVAYFRGDSLGAEVGTLRWLLWLAPLFAALVAVWELAWWNWQKKKYA